MRKFKPILAAVAVAAGLGITISAAEAAGVTYDLTYNINTGRSALPTLTGTVEFTIDPANVNGYKNVQIKSLSDNGGFTQPFYLSYTSSPKFQHILHFENDEFAQYPKNDVNFSITDINYADLVAGHLTSGKIVSALYETATGSVFGNGTYSISAVSAVPIPAALPLFASGIVGLGVWGRKKMKKSAVSAAA